MCSKPFLRVSLFCATLLFLMCGVRGKNRFAVRSALPDSSGVYLTLDDFLHKRLSISYNCGAKRSRIRIHHRPQISVVRNSVRHTFQLNQIFGFRKCGVDYRAYGDRHFEILSARKIFLYKYTYEEEIGSHFRTRTSYYFSETAGSTLFPLTRHYLKWLFRSDEEFVQLIDTSFVTEDELILFDSAVCMYRIEKIFLKSGK